MFSTVLAQPFVHDTEFQIVCMHRGMSQVRADDLRVFAKARRWLLKLGVAFAAARELANSQFTPALAAFTVP